MIKTPEEPPRLAGHKHVFRMAVRPAFFTEFDLHDVEDRGFLTVRITGLFESETAGNGVADGADPSVCDQADPGDTSMVVLVGVGQTDDAVDSDGGAFIPSGALNHGVLNSKYDG